MSEFKELVKSVNRVRGYVRDFFVSGWRSRSDYAASKRRSYDNEKSRVMRWFGEEYMRKLRYSDGRQAFALSVDMNDLERNPMYEVWRAKSFSLNDMSLYFFIMDALSSGGSLTVNEVMDRICGCEYEKEFEISTVAAKLNEYAANGILSVRAEKGKKLYSIFPLSWESLPDGMMDAVDFFTEAAPVGVIGSFIQDEAERENKYFRFKRHFIVHTLEDEVLLDLLDAIHGRLYIELKVYSRKDNKEIIVPARGLPLRILVSAQGGRRYVAMKDDRGFIVRRLDRIHSVKRYGAFKEFEKAREGLDRILENAWGVMFESDGDIRGGERLERVELRLYIDERRDKRVLDRLMREKRNGTVEREGENTFIYRNKLWYAREIMPFVKSFTGHILSFTCDNGEVEETYRSDMEKMAAIYGGGDGE